MACCDSCDATSVGLAPRPNKGRAKSTTCKGRQEERSTPRMHARGQGTRQTRHSRGWLGGPAHLFVGHDIKQAIARHDQKLVPVIQRRLCDVWVCGHQSGLARAGLESRVPKGTCYSEVSKDAVVYDKAVCKGGGGTEKRCKTPTRPRTTACHDHNKVTTNLRQ